MRGQNYLKYILFFSDLLFIICKFKETITINMIGIYKITNPNKSVYIGQSINIEKRISQYKRLKDCKRQKVLYRSFIKHGIEKHKFEILCICDILELNERERYYQDMFCVLNKHGLNCLLTKSNNRSGELSIETKKKISKTRKENKNDYWIGRKHSAETIAKMRVDRANISDETRMKMKLAKQNMSEETKLKMSLAAKERFKNNPISEETRLKMRNRNLGSKRSEEARHNMRIAQKGKVISPEQMSKLLYACRNPTPETRKKLSDAMKNRQEDIRRVCENNKKIILNRVTGIYYFGFEEAALSICKSYKYVQNNLTRNKINNTDLILC